MHLVRTVSLELSWVHLRVCQRLGEEELKTARLGNSRGTLCERFWGDLVVPKRVLELKNWGCMFCVLVFFGGGLLCFLTRGYMRACLCANWNDPAEGEPMIVEIILELCS